MQPVKHNLQNKKRCRKCVSAHVAQWERSRRYTCRPRVRVPFWPFFHCPLPTAHCPLLTAHLQTADRSGKLGKVESLMSRRQNAASAVNRCVAAHAKVRAHRCPTLRAKVGDRNAHCILPCLLQNNICNRCCGTAKLSISPFLHVLATLASRKKLPRTHQ